MIKRTLYFGNPAYLSLKLKQMVVKLPQKGDEERDENELTRTVPIEDIERTIQTSVGRIATT